MTTSTPPIAGPVASGARDRRPSRATRRTGYVFGLLANLLLLWLINAWPGWEAVPFLTGGFRDVLWLVDLSLWAGVVTNAIYVLRDPRWLTSLGGAATAAIGLAAVVGLWQVFPFDLNGVDAWTVLFRVALALGMIGSGIGIVVNTVTLVRALVGRGDDERRRSVD
jgi:hypothetical protein